ncbi:MAG: zincin-like metallopeptidase domain-containing protein [Saprospiraceae bacterium]|jgi:antirestriction protein ArdC
MKNSAMTEATVITSNLYEEVTNKIISMIEQGVAPWRRTWSTYGLARNYGTDHIYTGINLILMNNTMHPIPYFLTFNQVKEQGGSIKKDAKAEKVIYFDVYYKDVNDKTLSKEEAIQRRKNGEEIQILKFIKYYNVFNIEDIEGFEFQIQEIELKPNEKIDGCESIIENMPKRPELRQINANRACYAPELDFVNMPSIEQFESAEYYYATFFHELVHSTGHASRLAREEVMNPQKFGGMAYSKEELVAETGASFLCSSVQIDYDNIIENNVAYLAGWLNVLREDSKFIFKVASNAQKAADYILKRRQLNGE